MKKNKWLWIFLIVLVLLVGWRIYEKVQSSGGKNDFGSGAANRKGKQAVSVETGKIVNMDMDDNGVFSGTLIARNEVIIAPKISGQLSKLYVNIGDKVKKGQVIAELDDRLYVQEFAKAKATSEQTREALSVAQKDIANLQSLLLNKYISQNDYDKANADFIATKARHDIAQAAKNTAEIQLSYTKIRAEWNSSETYRVIGEKFVNEGSMLNAGASIVTMLDISTLIAVIDVIESDYAKIKIGQIARITADSYPGQTFTGKIARIAPLLQEASRQARVEIEIANPNALLKPGMYARVMITYNQKKNITAIPAAALCKNKGEQGVFLVDKQKQTVSFVKVQTGIQNSDFIEIISPDIKGEVVTLGQDQLDDGKSIILPGAEGSKPDKQRRKQG